MSTTTPVQVSEPDHAAVRRNGFLLVFSCTIFGAVAQILIKTGMGHFKPELWALLTNFRLIAGYFLYGVNTLLMVLALKNGEMSRLYPIIALTYVWTVLLSYALLGETSNPYKNAGIAIIVIGVAVMGRSGKK